MSPEIKKIIRKWVKEGYTPLEAKIYTSKKYGWIIAAHRERWRQEQLDFMASVIFGKKVKNNQKST